MAQPYLEITYRQGKPFAAYLYLERRPGDKSARTEPHDSWIVDFAPDGRVIGVEFLQVGNVDLAALNRVLVAAHHPPLSNSDLMPLQAA
ncbi:MAG TPA: DUF2283 domain-containing protein [Tepidisphaeraceae bacterium]|jgi:hypothetical protein|nr:DUF2283 domain-containing protein [Tepidisphaeraceae bacterium]